MGHVDRGQACVGQVPWGSLTGWFLPSPHRVVPLDGSHVKGRTPGPISTRVFVDVAFFSCLSCLVGLLLSLSPYHSTHARPHARQHASTHASGSRSKENWLNLELGLGLGLGPNWIELNWIELSLSFLFLFNSSPSFPLSVPPHTPLNICTLGAFFIIFIAWFVWVLAIPYLPT